MSILNTIGIDINRDWKVRDIGRIIPKLPKISRRSRSEPVSDQDLAALFSGESSWTGIDVNRTSILGVSGVYACNKVLSETLASLPLLTYKRLEKGKERAINYPIYKLLFIQPNREQTAFNFKELMQHHVTMTGNAYAQIIYGGDGYPKELWPLDPERMKVSREKGKLVYDYIQSKQSKPTKSF